MKYPIITIISMLITIIACLNYDERAKDMWKGLLLVFVVVFLFLLGVTSLFIDIFKALT